MDSIFRAEHVSKTFEKFKLEDVSFVAEPGTIIGVIGKNGCGKTTLLNCLMGLEPCDKENANQGNETVIELEGNSLFTEEKAYKDKMAYVFPEPYFDKNLTPRNCGRRYGRYYSSFDQERYQSLLQEYGVIELEDKYFETQYIVQSGFFKKVLHLDSKWEKKALYEEKAMDKLSQGQQIRAQLAFALSYDASVYFLDEPSGNLDTEFRDQFYQTIRDIVSDDKKCVLYASHLVEEMENFADYILWLQEENGVGRCIFYGSIEELRESYRMISGEEELLEKVPKELIVGGKRKGSRKELLIYNKPELLEKEGSSQEMKDAIRCPDLKEIMYYVEKGKVIGVD